MAPGMRSALAVAVLAVLAAAPVTANKNHPKHKPTPQPTFSPTKSPATLSPVRQARSSEIADGEARPNMKFAATLSVSGPLCAAPARSRTARNISLCRARCTVSRTLHEVRPLRVRGCHARGRALTSLPRRHGQKCIRFRDASALTFPPSPSPQTGTPTGTGGVPTGTSSPTKSPVRL